MKLFQPVHEFDLALFNWCMALRRRELLTALGRAISRTADGWLYALFAMAYGALEWPQATHFLKYFLSAFVIERLIYFVLKNSFRRNRPQEAIDEFSSFIIPSDKFSFPSGHTSAAFLFAVFVGYLIPALLPFLLVWAVLVALSRIFLGVHFPTDTVVGAMLGSGVAISVLNYGAFL
ncbi:phosphatase PAP2 family protein [Reinekea marinisedimentorum]|uniref:undecaprenyl-diphosphate phosphatase n=1 Tax=Reinekea marinisedimentorum TaxID=230495 RepID=A0A4V2UJU4_9GAMM|nr:phosphatase PAP2 family protein [Reinekea marinisedimentorum]TCS41371.1 undecaprenyl-diphosphatase [Reinekea marinisedimentorum]